MSGTSNVGQGSVYEADDQRPKESQQDQAKRFHQGKENSHKVTDAKDQRTLANRVAQHEEVRNEHSRKSPELTTLKQDAESDKNRENRELQKDPTLPARNHGNEPSKGAKIDAEILAEEKETLRKKGVDV